MVRWNYLQSHRHRCGMQRTKGTMKGREAVMLNKDLERGGKQKAKEKIMKALAKGKKLLKT